MSLEKHISPYKKRIPLYKQIASLESEVAKYREALRRIQRTTGDSHSASTRFDWINQIAQETLNPKDALKGENQ